ncbi:MAG: chemotaxis response regulator protein-glutamate methylesterase [Maricaulaceae bacterium]
MKKVTVLIVDDSPTMRSVIKRALRRDADIEVVGEAKDPYDAREKIKALNPDVLTLDIEMPRMSGLQFLKKIMELRPMPVIMLSSLTQSGANDTLEALSIGAFDCVAKPTSGDYIEALGHLPKLIKAASKYKPAGAMNKLPVKTVPTKSFYPGDKVIAIGSSTGGVEALQAILANFPANCPPTIITQHMPPSFLGTFATRLNKLVEPEVSLASQGAVLSPGKVYLAPGGDHHLEIKGHHKINCHLLSGGRVSGHIPSVDVMFNSVASTLGERAIGVILTGMGRDGAKGLLEIRRAGGRTLGQDERSCVVYGMPRAAYEIGAVERQVSLKAIGAGILALASEASKARKTA